jgi:hypothetical protein
VLPLLGVLPLPTSVKPEALSVVFPGGLNDALRDPPGAEGGHEGAVLTTQHDDVGIRLVEVVVELGELGSVRGPMTWKGTLHTKPRGGDLFEVRGLDQPTLPVTEAHVYGHVLLAPPVAAYYPAHHAASLGDPAILSHSHAGLWLL